MAGIHVDSDLVSQGAMQFTASTSGAPQPAAVPVQPTKQPGGGAQQPTKQPGPVTPGAEAEAQQQITSLTVPHVQWSRVKEGTHTFVAAGQCVVAVLHKCCTSEHACEWTSP